MYLATFVWDATNGMRNLQDLLVNDLGLTRLEAARRLGEAV
jgi:hypothetical protein